MSNSAPAMAKGSEKQAAKSPDAGAAMRRPALDIEEDFSKYEVKSRTERFAILKGLGEQGASVTFYFNDGYDFLLTTLIEMSADGRTMVFDYGSNMEMNRRALRTDEINCVSSKEQVKIQFRLHGVDPVSYDGRDAFLSDLPDSLIRLQRREHFRLATSLAKPLSARIPLLQKDGSIVMRQAVVVDISGGGIGLNVPPDFPCLKVDAQFLGVDIDLPNVGSISVDMVVRNLYDVAMPNGSIRRRAGCQFLTLKGATMARLQRCIIQIERERKARGI